MLNDTEWKSLIDEYFKCPATPDGVIDGLYVLGSFATNVTLYTQQVRAFNLIYGLTRVGALKAGDSIAVVGAGAGGLTVAAAAQHIGATVHILEEREGILELQLNNRQRWIHPHIYNWPDPASLRVDARLPLLMNWKAGYAENVAEQLEKRFEPLVRSARVNLNTHVKRLKVTQPEDAGHRFSLNFTSEERGTHSILVDHLFLCVGFGEEAHSATTHSYWAEDDFDSGFRDPKEKWLVSGVGDGALTDLMRLTIKRFRHGKVIEQFQNLAGIENFMTDLKSIEDDESYSNHQVSDQFKELVDGLHLANRLSGMLRTVEPVVLNTKSGAIYGRRASALNRLVVALLAEQGAFTIQPGKMFPAEFVNGKFRVRFGHEKAKPEEFDRVIVRHGPAEPSVLRPIGEWFPDHNLNLLQSRWQERLVRNDKSRIPHWPRLAFGPEDEPAPISIATLSQPVANAVGVRMSCFTFQKDLKDDGSSVVSYIISGLTVSDENLAIEGVHFYFESPAGIIGKPILGEDEKRLGLSWEADPRPSLGGGDPVSTAKRAAQTVSGVLKFPETLTSKSEPLSFSVKFIVLNGDALSAWEFQHLYDMKDAVHVDGRPLDTPQGYIARCVWCPIDQLVLRVTLPRELGLGQLVPLFYVLDDRYRIESKHVVRDRLLHLYPSADTGWRASNTKWQLHDPAKSAMQLVEAGQGVWELSVPSPPIGTYYEMGWTLPLEEHVELMEEIAEEARVFRSKLLRYRSLKRRHKNTGKHKVIEGLIQEFKRRMFDRIPSPPEEFELGLMTFNSDNNRLEYIIGVRANGDLVDPAYDLKLPLGVGLSGACFKKPDRTYVYVAEHAGAREGWPEYYLQIDERQSGRSKPHNSMVSIPLDHPRWDPSLERPGVDRSRQCIGVLDISVRSSSPWFEAVREEKNLNEMNGLQLACQEFGERLMRDLG